MLISLTTMIKHSLDSLILQCTMDIRMILTSNMKIYALKDEFMLVSLKFEVNERMAKL